MSSREAAISSQMDTLRAEHAKRFASHPKKKTVPISPEVARCLHDVTENWVNLESCLRGTPAMTKLTADAGAHPILASASHEPPVPNPSWLLPEVDYDNASRLATCHDFNTGVDSTHPLCTRMQMVSRWGTDEPQFRQGTAVKELIHSAWPTNPSTDEFVVHTRVQNATQYGMRCDLVQAQTGTLASVVPADRTYGFAPNWNVTLGAGLTKGMRIENTDRVGSRAWLVVNTAGNAWQITQPFETSHDPPAAGATPHDDWANGDHYIVYQIPFQIPLAEWRVSWEDLADSPDTRPDLRDCAWGQGVNTGAGIDTRQVRLHLNGDSIVGNFVTSSTTFNEIDYTHGSRGPAALMDNFGSDDSARTNILGIGGNTQGFKLIQVYAGRWVLGEFANVELLADVELDTGSIWNGTILYDGVNLSQLGQVTSVEESTVVPLTSTSRIWGPAAMSLKHSYVRVNSPEMTYFNFHGWTAMDGIFKAKATDCNFTHCPEWPYIDTAPYNLSLSIASGGFGGHAYGYDGSVISDGSPYSPPAPYFKFDGGISGIGCETPGSDCTIVGTPAVTVTYPIPVPDGGTGDTTGPAHAIADWQGTSPMGAISPSTSGQCLCSNGASSETSFQQVAYANISGTPTAVTVASGTDISVTGGPAYTVALAAGAGTTQQLYSNPGGVGTWEGVAGVVNITGYASGSANFAFAPDPITSAHGATGVANPTAHDVPIAEGSSAFTFISPSTSGLVLTSNGTSADPSFQALTTPGTITSAAAHGLNVDVSPSSFQTVASQAVTIVSGQIYVVSAATQWSLSVGTAGPQTVQWGISIDSTSAVTRTYTYSSALSLTDGSAGFEIYSGQSAASHTLRVLAKTTSVTTGLITSLLNADLLVQTQ